MMKAKIELSVIVPAYNIPEKFLRRCVDSLISQQGDNLEFIVLNDGSTDSWVDPILRKATLRDKRFKYINKPNTGVSDTRNEGMRLAQGDYLMFVDADDEVLPDACQLSLTKIKNENADVVVMRFTSSKMNKPLVRCRKVLSVSEKIRLLEDIVGWRTKSYKDLNVNVDAPWGKIFRKSIIDDHSVVYPVGLARSQDAIFCLHYFEYAEKIVIDNRDCVYSYNDNMESVCRSCSDTSVRMLPFILKELEGFVDTYHADERFYDAVGTRAVKGIAEAERRFFFDAECNLCEKEKKKRYRQLLYDKYVSRNLKRARYRDLHSIPVKIYLFMLKHHLVALLFLVKKFWYK